MSLYYNLCKAILGTLHSLWFFTVTVSIFVYDSIGLGQTNDLFQLIVLSKFMFRTNGFCYKFLTVTIQE